MDKYICPFCENWSTDHKGAFTRHINSHNEDSDETEESNELLEIIEELETIESDELEFIEEQPIEEIEENDYICGCGHMKSQGCSCPNSNIKYFREGV